jgi:hypothetical protein
MYLAEDQKSKREIESYLNVLYDKHIGKLNDKIIIDTPSLGAGGEYELGDVIFNEKTFGKFGLNEDEFIQHVGIFGRSGSGKTNVAFLILKELKRKKKPFLIFDWKRNYRDLLRIKNFDDVLVFGIGKNISTKFGFNPLKNPPGIPARVWLKKLIEVINHAYFLGEGCAYLLQKALDDCYRRCKVYQGSGVYPTFKDVLYWLENYKCKGREAQWMSSTLRAVSVLCYGEMGDVLNKHPEISIDKLLSRDVILELDTLTDSDKTFLIESLLLWIHHFRMQETGREKFKHAILIEEAHHILLKRKQEMTGSEAITDVLLREIRELGESVILLDQHPSLISLPALGNTYCTIAMNLKHKSDTDSACACLLLGFNDKDVLGKLEVGYGVVRLQGRGFKPFLVKFPLFEIEKGVVNDLVLDEKMQRICQDIGLVAREFPGEKGFLIQGKYESGNIGEHRSTVVVDAEQGEESVNIGEHRSGSFTEGEILFLKDIFKNPVATTMERYGSLGFSRRKGGAVKKDLLSKGLIEVRKIRHNGSWVLLQALTGQGKKVLEELGFKVVENDRGGGLEHEYWKERVLRYYQRRGFNVVKEYPIGGGKAVDLLVEKGDLRFPVEIETGNSDVKKNIEKCLGCGFSSVVVVPLKQGLFLECQELAEKFGEGEVKVLHWGCFGKAR